MSVRNGEDDVVRIELHADRDPLALLRDGPPARAPGEARTLALVPSVDAVRSLEIRLVREGLAPSRLVRTLVVPELVGAILEAAGQDVPVAPRAVVRAEVRRVLALAHDDPGAPAPVRAFLAGQRAEPFLAEDGELDALVLELEEYHRGSFAGELHAEMLDVARAGELDPFTRLLAERHLEVFAFLSQRLESRLQALSLGVPTGAHRIRSALAALAGVRLRELFPGLERLVVAGHTLFTLVDLRLLAELARAGAREGFRVHVFLGAPLAASLRPLLAELGVELPAVAAGVEVPAHAGAHRLLAGEPLRSGSGVAFASLPDRRRELAWVAARVREATFSGPGDGAEPAARDVLLVARRPEAYADLAEQVFAEHRLAIHVATPERLASHTAFRLVEAVLGLLAARSEGAPLEADALHAALSLGFTPPDTRRWRDWPVSHATLLFARRRLRSILRENGAPGAPSPRALTLEAWTAALEPQAETPYGRSCLALLDVVRAWSAVPPQDAHQAWRRVDQLLWAMRRAVRPWSPRAPRFGGEMFVEQRHVGWGAQRLATVLREELRPLLRALPGALSWAAVLVALRQAVGQRTIRAQARSASAVRLVGAHEVGFERADLVFVLGLRSDELPRRPARSVFFARAYRQLLAQRSRRALLRTPENERLAEAEAFRLALAALRPGGRLFLTRPYMDERGHRREWSSFVEARVRAAGDAVTPPEAHLPARPSLAATPLAVRRRLALYHLHARPPAVSLEDARALLDALPADDWSEATQPRLARLLAPPAAVLVRADEPWLAVPGLAALAGAPFHAHELDLLAQCPLKLYFQQFYRRERFCDATERARMSWEQRRRLGDPARFRRLLARLGARHALPAPEAALEVVRAELGEDARWCSGWLLDELDLLACERRDGVERAWEWVEAGRWSLDLDGLEVLGPAHRLDRVRGETGERVLATLPLGSAQEVSDAWQENREALVEAQLPLCLLHYGDEALGAQYLAPAYRTDPGRLEANGTLKGRKGWFERAALPLHKPGPGYHPEVWMDAGRDGGAAPHGSPLHTNRRQLLAAAEWRDLRAGLRTRLAALARAHQPGADVRYARGERPPCARCEHRDVCQLPRVEELA